MRALRHPATWISAIALFVALGGPATAAKLITSKSIKNRSITASDIKQGTIGSGEIRNGSLTGSDIKDRSIVVEDLALGTAVTGPQGAQGPTGAVGPQGPPGVTGPAGKDGTNTNAVWAVVRLSDGQLARGNGVASVAGSGSEVAVTFNRSIANCVWNVSAGSIDTASPSAPFEATIEADSTTTLRAAVTAASGAAFVPSGSDAVHVSALCP